jgi:hypothetical protein
MTQKDVSNYLELQDFVSKNNGVVILEFHTYTWPHPAPVRLAS